MSAGDLTPQQFATAVLQRLGITPTTQNVRAVVGWTQAEGGHWHNAARYNPLNTTQPMPGAGNTGSQGNIKVYTSWSQGIDATVKTLQNGRYGGVLDALKGKDPGAVAAAIGSSPWGTDGALLSKTIAGAHGAPASAPDSTAGAPSPGKSTSKPTGPWALRQLLSLALLGGGATLVYFGGARILGVNGSRPIAAAAKATAKAAVVAVPK